MKSADFHFFQISIFGGGEVQINFEWVSDMQVLYRGMAQPLHDSIYVLRIHTVRNRDERKIIGILLHEMVHMCFLKSCRRGFSRGREVVEKIIRVTGHADHRQRLARAMEVRARENIDSRVEFPQSIWSICGWLASTECDGCWRFVEHSCFASDPYS